MVVPFDPPGAVPDIGKRALVPPFIAVELQFAGQSTTVA
jgi:hypothetical protein